MLKMKGDYAFQRLKTERETMLLSCHEGTLRYDASCVVHIRAERGSRLGPLILKDIQKIANLVGLCIDRWKRDRPVLRRRRAF
jgi:hypothetical protein